MADEPVADRQDSGERGRCADMLSRRNRALAMLSRGNRALIHSTDEARLLQTMCNVATEVGGYRMAWVGYRRDDAAQSVQAMAATGFEKGYLERAAISWGDNERGRGPTGVAIRTGLTQVAKDFLTDPLFLPWRDDAVRHGYRSNIALPLMHRGSAFGALTIYAGHADAFDEAEVPLLEEMAEDLAYGIMALRNTIAREKAEHQVELSYSLLKAALESTADGILVMALSGDAESFNQHFVDMWGLPRAVMETSRIEQIGAFMAEQTCDPATFLRRLREMDQRPAETHGDIIEMRDGRTLARISRPQLLGGKVIGRVSSYRDITAQRQHEAQLTHLATHDALTGLPNRNLLTDRLSQAIAHAGRTEHHLGVLLLDLDHFKLINDGMGHEYGDLLLKEVATRLAAGVRQGDTVARMGGDEFVILLPGLMHEEDAAPVAAKFMEVVARPTTVVGRELFSTASIGIALYLRDGQDASTLLKHADAAMYRAKDRGGNCFQFITSEINDQITRRLTIANRLRNALARQEMTVHYQPQFDVLGGRLCGAEALIRWRHPKMGMVSPGEFIPVAEETGLIFELGEWVAATVFAQQRAWQAAGLPPIQLAINVSARQLDHDGLPLRLPSLVGHNGADPGRLEIEITEGMLMKHPERAEKTLRGLRALGFSIAIDDFGTGYSSLGYLKRFPIDKLKVDRSFIADIPADTDAAAITRAIIAMAHELRLTVVAEGVETDAQMAFLRDHGCDMVQGYLTGRPVPAQEFEAILGAQMPA